MNRSEILEKLTGSSAVGRKLAAGELGSVAVFVARLVLASAAFALALLLDSVTEPWVTVILVAAALVAGCDVIISAVFGVMRGDWLNRELLTCAAALLAFLFGAAVEGCALILLYQIAGVFIDYAVERTRRSVLDTIICDTPNANRMENGREGDGARVGALAGGHDYHPHRRDRALRLPDSRGRVPRGPRPARGRLRRRRGPRGRQAALRLRQPGGASCAARSLREQRGFRRDQALPPRRGRAAQGRGPARAPARRQALPARRYHRARGADCRPASGLLRCQALREHTPRGDVPRHSLARLHARRRARHTPERLLRRGEGRHPLRQQRSHGRHGLRRRRRLCPDRHHHRGQAARDGRQGRAHGPRDPAQDCGPRPHVYEYARGSGHTRGLRREGRPRPRRRLLDGPRLRV